jgi:DNA-binding transcriptional MerR regulator
VGSLDIAEVARRSGIPASALRFYEEKGLITSIGRCGLRRLFAPAVRDQFALIAFGRQTTFSLEEIARMFAPDGAAAHRPSDAHRPGRGVRPDEPKAQRTRDDLRHSAACPAPSHMECPTFRRYLDVAASGTPGKAQEENPPKSADRRIPAAAG